MKKVSFDFDETLDRKAVQKFAKKLVQMGYEVWIVTSRLSNEKSPNPKWNNDLFEVAKYCGIPVTQIHFTNGDFKYKFLKDKEYIFHIDDDWSELRGIQNYAKGTIPVNVYSSNWKNKLVRILKLKLSDFEE